MKRPETAQSGRSIANGYTHAYLMPMLAKRLVRILAMLALVLAPLGMAGGSAAMAQPAAIPSASHHEQAASMPDHCAELGGETDDHDGSSPQGDCLSDCAVSCAAIAAPGNGMADPAMVPAMARPRAFADPLHGLSPESADPPPRTA